MSSLFNFYRMKTNEDDEIVFEKVKEEDITICGKTINEIVTILNGLDIERITGIKMAMENLGDLINKYMEAQMEAQEKIMRKTFEEIDKHIPHIY